MIIDTRPIKICKAGEITCEGCQLALDLYKRSRELLKNEKYKKGHWVAAKAAKALYEDFGSHNDNPRQVPLAIVSGIARWIKTRVCWNCKEALSVCPSKWSEFLVCTNCLVLQYADYIDGKIEAEEVPAKFTNQDPREWTSGLWEDFYWDKEKRDMVRKEKK
jgi:hypothetical protein